VATEQFSELTDDEVASICAFLHDRWTTERAMHQETKIPSLYKAAEKIN
jgi:hypothetical protein